MLLGVISNSRWALQIHTDTHICKSLHSVRLSLGLSQRLQHVRSLPTLFNISFCTFSISETAITSVTVDPSRITEVLYLSNTMFDLLTRVSTPVLTQSSFSSGSSVNHMQTQIVKFSYVMIKDGFILLLLPWCYFRLPVLLDEGLRTQNTEYYISETNMSHGGFLFTLVFWMWTQQGK